MAYDFDGLSKVLLSQITGFLPSWLPGGKLVGREYTCSDLNGGPGDSLKFNIDKGYGQDFATGVKFGDCIALYAAVTGLKNGDAAKKLADQIGFELVPSNGSKPPAVVHKITAPPPAVPHPDMTHHKYGKPSKSWTYVLPDGSPLFCVARYESPDGKQFFPWVWSATISRWVSKGWPAPRPLYGLDLLAQRPGVPVLIVEGEGTADAARTIAGGVYAVVTWPNGSNAAQKADWSPVYGRNVLIWPDMDAPGRKAAQQIAMILTGKCAEIKVLKVEGETGWDAKNALDEGWDWMRFKVWARPLAQVITVPEPAPSAIINVDNQASGTGAVAATQVNVTVGDGDDHVDVSKIALWEKLGIPMSGHGKPVISTDAAMRVMENHAEMKDVIWYDEFHKKYYTTWGEAGERQREWEDVDDINLTIYMQRLIGLQKISLDMVRQAAVSYAHKHVRNEPKEWLTGLKWDGEPRVEGFLDGFLGAEASDYTRAASKNFWVGMVARVFRPGCKLDNMLVLEGPQGVGKGLMLEAIGGKWYTEASESVQDKDFFMALHGKLLVEISELDSFRRAEVTRIKMVISSRVDRYRSPFGRFAQDHPRMSIFIGTTNETHYLKDATGGRRFWPIKCGTIFYDRVPAIRENLFAEAVYMFNRGDDWYSMPEDATLAMQASRRRTDEWEYNIKAFLHGRDTVTITELICDCLKLEVGKMDKVMQHRVAGILKTLKYEQAIDGQAWTKIDLLAESEKEMPGIWDTQGQG